MCRPPQARFTILQSGEIDVLIRDSTLTFIRNIQLGLDEIAVNFYAGEGFLVSKKLGVTKITELNGATICVITGATLELNIADFARSTASRSTRCCSTRPRRRCRRRGGPLRRLHRRHAAASPPRARRMKNPDDWVVLPELICKEPLGIHARDGDEAWSRILLWTHYALLTAEELGVTKANADQMKQVSKDPFVRRLLGARGRLRQAAGARRRMGATGDQGRRQLRRALRRVLRPEGARPAARPEQSVEQGRPAYALPFR